MPETRQTVRTRGRVGPNPSHRRALDGSAPIVPKPVILCDSGGFSQSPGVAPVRRCHKGNTTFEHYGPPNESPNRVPHYSPPPLAHSPATEISRLRPCVSAFEEPLSPYESGTHAQKCAVPSHFRSTPISVLRTTFKRSSTTSD